MTLHLDDKVAGAVLGAAIGDALGHPTEFLSAESIRQRFPPYPTKRRGAGLRRPLTVGR